MRSLFFALILLGSFLANPNHLESEEIHKHSVNLGNFEKKVYSQNGEDGVLEKIFALLNIQEGIYVEFGVRDGHQCNTRFLREVYSWSGLMMDGGYHKPEINLMQEFITAENINELFEKYHVPYEFDLLSIDIDGNDFYVWHALNDHYQPKVVIIEYNASHLPGEDKVILYDPLRKWDQTNYFGASISALYKLGRRKGYSLIYAEKKGVNLFFIRDDILAAMPVTFFNVNKVRKLYRSPQYGKNPKGGHPEDPQKRPYVTAESILN